MAAKKISAPGPVPAEVRAKIAPNVPVFQAPAGTAFPEPTVEVVAETPVKAPVEEPVADPVETAANEVTSAPTSVAADVPATMKTQTEAKMTMDKAIKTTEEFMAFGQGNVEAFLKSSQIWAAGVQDLGKHIAATAQAQVDVTVANVKALSSVKSLKEAIDLQTTIAKTSVDKLLAETGKLTDATVKLTEQTMAPITARVTLATEKFGSATTV